MRTLSTLIYLLSVQRCELEVNAAVTGSWQWWGAEGKAQPPRQVQPGFSQGLSVTGCVLLDWSTVNTVGPLGYPSPHLIKVG